MEIKNLTTENLEEYLELRVKMLNENQEVGYDISKIEEQTREYYIENINKNLIIFGMFDNNKIVGVAAIEIIKRLPTPKINNSNSTTGYICGVYTREEYRNQGISKKLVSTALNYGKNRGITRFKLSTHNPIAANVYKKLGFEYDQKAMILNI